MNKKTIIGTSALALLLASLASPAWSGNKFANVKATAECTLDGTILTVTVGIEVTKTNEDQVPEVGTVDVVLEQHTAGISGWPEVAGSAQSVDVDQVFTDGIEGDTATVATFDYPDSDPLVPNICDLVSLDANAVRAVVDVEIENANANQRNGQGTSHLARCISFANPC